jgi:sugar phosphate isomerase/epimerase
MAFAHILVSAHHTAPQPGIEFAREKGLGFEIPALVFPNAWRPLSTTVENYQHWMSGFTGVRTVHGPVIDMNPVSVDPLIRSASRQRYQSAVEAADAMGCTTLVFHTQYTPIYPAARITEGWISALVDYWQEMQETVLAQHPGVVCVLENFLDPTPDVVLEIVSRANCPNLRACLDVGHVNLFSDVSSTRWIDELGPWLHHVHLHNNVDGDDHLAFGEGNVPLEEILETLAESRHPYQLVLELFDHEALLASHTWFEGWCQRHRVPTSVAH